MLEFLKGFVRPYLAYTGWAVMAGLTVYLVVNYSTPDIAKLLIGAFIGSVTTILGFYIQARERKE